MFTNESIKDYDQLNKMLEALIKDENDNISNLSNASALLNVFLDDINWVGFYLLKDNLLKLGPFQGLPACVTIPVGKGVCGTAVMEKKVMRIEDVNAFPGHIACDANSQSEIVIPLYKDHEVYGVLDIDAPILNRFTEEDEQGLVQFAEVLASYLI